jgi:mono/diheme cytochrome c family protein
MSRILSLVTVTLLLLAACSSSSDGGETGIAPQDPQLVTQGDGVYQASCAECHGTDVRGTDQGPSLLSVVYEPGHHSDVAFLLAVQRGSSSHHWPFGDMLPVEGLTTDDITAIVAFVRETQRTEGFEPYPPP